MREKNSTPTHISFVFDKKSAEVRLVSCHLKWPVFVYFVYILESLCMIGRYNNMRNNKIGTCSLILRVAGVADDDVDLDDAFVDVDSDVKNNQT